MSLSAKNAKAAIGDGTPAPARQTEAEVGQKLRDPIAPGIASDIDLLLASFRLQKLRRYFHQRFWEQESREAEYADRIEGSLKLENVAAHSWHVADAALILAPNFPHLDSGRCVKLAILHDKLEMFTGDFNPVGRDGTGQKTHAFNVSKQEQKHSAELQALKHYLSLARQAIRPEQENLILEGIEGRTEESKFIKAIDKLQALAFVHLKKGGNVTDSHLHFTLMYSEKSIKYFPGISDHYFCLRDRFLDSICRRRGVDRATLDKSFLGQIELQL